MICPAMKALAHCDAIFASIGPLSRMGKPFKICADTLMSLWHAYAITELYMFLTFHSIILFRFILALRFIADGRYWYWGFDTRFYANVDDRVPLDFVVQNYQPQVLRRNIILYLVHLRSYPLPKRASTGAFTRGPESLGTARQKYLFNIEQAKLQSNGASEDCG